MGRAEFTIRMKTLFLTNEYPPTVYGGAGVHVDYLSRELAKLMQVEVRCYGRERREQRLDTPSLKATGYGLDTAGYTAPKPLHSVFGAVQRGLDWNTDAIDANIVHLHTWYTHMGGILAKLNYGVPMVITVHSLEPLRPWKREQLGGGYDFSCWVEKTALEMADAVIAVSRETKADILRLFNVPDERVHIIYNGIDLDEYQRVETTAALEQVRSRPENPVRALRRGASRGRRGSSIWSTRSNTWTPISRSCFAQARLTRRKSRRK